MILPDSYYKMPLYVNYSDALIERGHALQFCDHEFVIFYTSPWALN
jgi:hypothetical protein